MNNKPAPAPTGSLVPTAVVTCAVLQDEINHFVAPLRHIVHVATLEQGLHNEPAKLQKQLQDVVDRVEATTCAQAIVLGYGLCSRGIEGVRTRRCLLVVTRAHDCITLLLGDKERYARYVSENPGTYWYSTGWNRSCLMPGRERYEKLLDKYRREYGEDNAQYLMESEQHWFKTYNRATFVDLTVGNTDKDVEHTRQSAQWLGWTFDYQKGDPDLLRALLECRWDHERFVVLQPGQTFRMTADHRVIEAVDGDGTQEPNHDQAT